MFGGDKEIEEVEEENVYPSSHQGEAQYLSPTIPSLSSSDLPHKRMLKTKIIQQL